MMKTSDKYSRPSAFLILLTFLCFQIPHAVRAQFTVVHTGNLLQNPAASSGSVSPWIPTGAWAVQNGPEVLAGGNVLSNCDGSRWFLNHRGLTLNPCSSCQLYANVFLTQTVSLSSYASIIQNSTPRLVYGGDAFAALKAVSGTCYSGQPFCHAGAYEVNFKVEFLNSSGGTIISNTSGAIFSPMYSCVTPGGMKKKCGYRQTVNTIPAGASSVRFTAKMTDGLSACNNPTTTLTFSNGFDNLFMEIVYSQDESGHHESGRIKKPPGPRPSVKATPTPKT
jgi:hypothetical protein